MTAPELIQYKAYERLNILYRISRVLSTFENVDKAFPQILSYVAEAFPLLTVVLVESWHRSPRTTIWHSADATENQIERAINYAKDTFVYLSGPDLQETWNFYSSPEEKIKLSRNSHTKKAGQGNTKNYIVLPLFTDKHSPLGILQFEGAVSLNENDLEFVNTLADLIDGALARHFRLELEKEDSKQEVREKIVLLNQSRGKIASLNMEHELRDAFISLLSHDLRNPITVISASAQLILREPENQDLNLTLAHRILKHVDRTNKMINDLLDANSIQSGECLPLKREMVDLSSVIQDAIMDLTVTYGNRFTLEKKEECTGLFDQNGVRRIIENLCINALKYGTRDESINIQLQKRSEKEVIIAVQNFGEIISKENLQVLFQKFHRSDSAVKSDQPGWGLGLTIVRGLTEAHGGKVEVSSESETGTIFTITLPQILSMA